MHVFVLCGPGATDSGAMWIPVPVALRSHQKHPGKRFYQDGLLGAIQPRNQPYKGPFSGVIGSNRPLW